MLIGKCLPSNLLIKIPLKGIKKTCNLKELSKNIIIFYFSMFSYIGSI